MRKTNRNRKQMAAVIFALNQHMTLLETEDLLASLPERSLYARES